MAWGLSLVGPEPFDVSGVQTESATNITVGTLPAFHLLGRLTAAGIYSVCYMGLETV